MRKTITVFLKLALDRHTSAASALSMPGPVDLTSICEALHVNSLQVTALQA